MSFLLKLSFLKKKKKSPNNLALSYLGTFCIFQAAVLGGAAFFMLFNPQVYACRTSHLK